MLNNEKSAILLITDSQKEIWSKSLEILPQIVESAQGDCHLLTMPRGVELFAAADQASKPLPAAIIGFIKSQKINSVVVINNLQSTQFSFQGNALAYQSGILREFRLKIKEVVPELKIRLFVLKINDNGDYKIQEIN